MYDTPRPYRRESGTPWAGHRGAGVPSADPTIGVAPVPSHPARAGRQSPTAPEGRHRYDVDPAGLRRRDGRSGWHWLLLVPIVASVLSPVYNSMEPEFGGMPFFYWFPLSLNLGAGACMLTVHLATRRGR